MSDAVNEGGASSGATRPSAMRGQGRETGGHDRWAAFRRGRQRHGKWLFVAGAIACLWWMESRFPKAVLLDIRASCDREHCAEIALDVLDAQGDFVLHAGWRDPARCMTGWMYETELLPGDYVVTLTHGRHVEEVALKLPQDPAPVLRLPCQ